MMQKCMRMQIHQGPNFAFEFTTVKQASFCTTFKIASKTAKPPNGFVEVVSGT